MPILLWDASSLLQTEVVYSVSFDVLPLESNVVLASIAWIARHSINATDAAVLETYVGYARDAAASDEACILVAADHRLLRAATEESLRTLNPESVSAPDAVSLITASA